MHDAALAAGTFLTRPSGGLIASGIVSQAFDQIFRGGTAALGHGWPIALGVTALGGALFGLGLLLRTSVMILPASSGHDLCHP